MQRHIVSPPIVTTPSFMQNKQRPYEHHLFIGITRGVMIQLPYGTIGKGVVSFDVNGKLTNRCTLHINKQSEEYDAFCTEYQSVMQKCHDDAGIEYHEPNELVLTGTVHESILASTISCTYTALIKSIRVAGYCMLDGKCHPLIEIGGLKVTFVKE